ncbi:uncharacterized protein A1O5_12057 [Cladophialophora psammophila CBS 110553]|uniref:Uncharacterized protein n=1 Tax=Cladophialophora psammophila CBS 110553 TaxID=1182543 RepID=W9VUN5_9EURO|nr:uncharacterized protein A1O5_12057 [Cladophialophora psammophila CBS 110553]EXJ59432.1 hypothetical protein A1O5_12057 [Cladophialophora psammophila CBS 110553]
MAPKFEQVFKLRAFLSKTDFLSLGPIKGGPHRYIATVTHGTLEGCGLKAQLLHGGGDWLLLDHSSGVAHLDIRAQARSEGGECFYLHYPGILKMDEATQLVLQWSPEAKTTRSEDHYFVTTPVFETSSQDFKWMEQNIFIGHGHWYIPGDGTQAVEYEIYKVVSA